MCPCQPRGPCPPVWEPLAYKNHPQHLSVTTHLIQWPYFDFYSISCHLRSPLLTVGILIQPYSTDRGKALTSWTSVFKDSLRIYKSAKRKASFLFLHQGTLYNQSKQWVSCNTQSGTGGASGGECVDPVIVPWKPPRLGKTLIFKALLSHVQRAL